ncbi:PDZ/DHR/GLGF domain protein [Chthoniobacter flavus Ellin428]|uniref:PDZ/DHR/GLGF domain protein n=1 Tax=Chthoniobacter flavus Ellin428 TaxID=497964 RepID=B4CVP9_9BACT|nr:S1C family serine protease [Chthoniobacter flavus]EDY21491.1 PDZ/DHR/GLGF domain protein [Chthoniobacter flavus Ellin428]TCO95442.1 S1-C subfamily serine protease [Chthoniobacter flavus]
MRRIAFLFASVLLPLACPVQADEVQSEAPQSVVRVNVTNQPWDFGRPWGKRPPYSRRAIGTILPDNQVLVTAELVANANYVELETAEGGQKVPARVEVVDYEANLALLKTDDVAFLKPFKPLELTHAHIGDTLSVWQLENTGTLLVTKGPMTTAEVTRYPIDDAALLVYRMTTPLQFRDSSFTLPVIKDGKLAGLVMRYDNTTNNAEILPAPVIEHFLLDAKKAPYEGFARIGITSSPTRDPQFRKYLGLDASTSGGVYIADVQQDGPAAQGGMEQGDVLLQIDGQAVDQDGNYRDQEYGKVGLAYLFSTKHFDGDKVKCIVFRKGEKKELNVTLKHRPVESYVVEPYIIDRAPKFYVLGGLVLQELSRQYLKEYGNDWQKKAPENFVYFDHQQNELFKNGPKKIVFLNRVLPSEMTVGYEELSQLVLTKINDMAIQSLDDVPKALAHPINGLHKIEFDGEPKIIFLDAAQVEAEAASFQKKYRLPELQHLN